MKNILIILTLIILPSIINANTFNITIKGCNGDYQCLIKELKMMVTHNEIKPDDKICITIIEKGNNRYACVKRKLLIETINSKTNNN